MIRVVVVDDQVLVRMGLRTLLEAEDDTELVGEAADGRAGVDLVRATRPDVVLMDIRMPVLDGLAALREITADPVARGRAGRDAHDVRDRRVRVRGARRGRQWLRPQGRRAGRAPASSPGGRCRRLPAGPERHATGDRAVRRPRARRAVAVHPQLGDLTEREREMVGWVATGRSNDEIAAALVISPATVRTHVSRAMIKLGARDRAQLVVFAIQSGLTVPDNP